VDKTIDTEMDLCYNVMLFKKQSILKDQFKRVRHDKHGDFLVRIFPAIARRCLKEIFLPTRLSWSFFYSKERFLPTITLILFFITLTSTGVFNSKTSSIINFSCGLVINSFLVVIIDSSRFLVFIKTSNFPS
jgi:hypothetical protein